MQIIPAIDLLGPDAVRLEQGDYNRVLFRQPIEEFMGRIVATAPPMVHIVDLEGAKEGALRPAMIARCATLANGIPLQVSGGIRSVAQANDALTAGATRVIIGTAAWSSEDALATFAAALGEQLVVAFDVKDGAIAVKGWLESSNISVEDAISRCQAAGVARLHVTAIDRDGTMRGPDLALYEQVVRSGIPVVAAGGVRDDADCRALDAIGCEGAIMGLGYLPRLGLSLDALVANE
jgi:phosphoribosylformimino-5-aminoimidazole carboxamide ribotide isomerase